MPVCVSVSDMCATHDVSDSIRDMGAMRNVRCVFVRACMFALCVCIQVPLLEESSRALAR